MRAGNWSSSRDRARHAGTTLTLEGARATAEDLREAGTQVEQLLAELSTSADTHVYRQVEEIVRLLTELYGSGLERIIDMAAMEAGPDILHRFVDDELVASLMVLHGLHPKDTITRVHEALERVRPYLGSHAGGVELLGLDEEGRAHLRLEGSCDGCPSSAVTVKYAIEGAIAELAPEVISVEVEGMAEDRPREKHAATESNVIPVGALFQECPVPGVGADR